MAAHLPYRASYLEDISVVSRIESVRGMNDVLPQESIYWQRLEQACRQLLNQYAYQEIRFPIVEKTELFKRCIGEVTDIVEKEMYTFDDRNGDSLSLRPEGTACCVRAGIQQGLLYNQIQRLWYLGPMFRHERPQKGRYRQFYQLGVEAFGMSSALIEAEHICMMQRLWQQLGLADVIQLEINNLGSLAARNLYRARLVEYYQQHIDELDEDSKARLQTNPLRILDSKNPDVKAVNMSAPSLLDHLDDGSKTHFQKLQALLTTCGIKFTVNPRIVRGLDYYNSTVYEWTTTALGAQGTVCAGGRYDSLVEQLGGKTTPGCGFAMGLERIILLMQQRQTYTDVPDIYLVLVGDAAAQQGLQLGEQLRQDYKLRVQTDCVGGSMKSQFKRADKSGAQYAVVIGDDELAKQQYTLKPLRGGEQQQLSFDDLANYLQRECVS